MDTQRSEDGYRGNYSLTDRFRSILDLILSGSEQEARDLFDRTFPSSVKKSIIRDTQHKKYVFLLVELEDYLFNSTWKSFIGARKARQFLLDTFKETCK